jgi:hypothetical protein
MYRSPTLLEAYSSPENGWLVCVGFLAAHLLFNVSAIFLLNSLEAVTE